MDFSQKYDPSRIALPGGVYALEQPNSPDISGLTTTRTYMVRHGYGAAVRDWFYRGIYYPDFGGYAGVDSVQIRRDTPCYDTVIIAFTAQRTFANPLGRGDEAQDPEFSLSDSGFSRPLELHPDYRAAWNYNLYGFMPTGTIDLPLLPDWAYSAPDLIDADGVNYLWAKEQPGEAPGGTWRMIMEMEKPGVTDYMETLPVIHEVRFFRSRKDRNAAAARIFRQTAPEETFGLNKEWLVTGISTSDDNKYYRVEMDYTGADSWDDELYQVVTDEQQ